MQMVELAQAVRAARSGDKDAVEALYRHYRKRLWFFVCRNIDSQQAAEDIVSDSFLTAIEKLSELRCDEAFGSWLYSIAYRKCLQHAQSEAGLARFDSDSELESNIDQSPLCETVKLPCDLIESEETRRQLRGAIESLKPDMRTAVMMYYFEQMSVAEVGEVLGISENAAKQKLFRARKKLCARLERFFKDSGMLCAVPLGAAIEAAFPKGYSAAAGSAVKVGLAARIAGLSAAAVIAVGAPLAMSSYQSEGYYRPTESVVSQSDELKEEASGFLKKLVGESFDFSCKVQGGSFDEGSAGGAVFVSQKGTAEDVGMPKLFLDNKDKWKISVCSEDHESGVYCAQMQFRSPATSVKLYCPPAGSLDENVTYRLYIPKYPYEHTQACKYIKIELQQPKSDVPIQDKLYICHKGGTDYQTEQLLTIVPETDNRVSTACTGIYNCDIKHLDDGKLDISITPETGMLADTNGYILNAYTFENDTQQSAVSLINIGDTDLAFAAQYNEYFHLKEKDLTGCDNELGTNGCWHIQITKIPPKCDRVKLIFKFSRDNEAFGKTANYTVTLNVDISRARNGG